MPEPIIATKNMIVQVFEEAATAYDRHGPSLFAQFGRRLVEQISLTPGARVLDVATGSGAVLLPAARLVGAEGRVTGIDRSEAMLQEAKRAVTSEGLTNVELRLMDAEHIEFPDQAFDVVTCGFSLFLFPDLEGALREIYRVCKPGGRLGVSVFAKTPFFDPAWPLLVQQIMTYQLAVQMPRPFSCPPEEVAAWLRRSDFGAIETCSETSEFVYANPEELWNFMLTVAGTRLVVMRLSEDKRARFKDEFTAKLRPLLRPDGLHLSVGTVYAVARR